VVGPRAYVQVAMVPEAPKVGPIHIMYNVYVAHEYSYYSLAVP